MEEQAVEAVPVQAKEQAAPKVNKNAARKKKQGGGPKEAKYTRGEPGKKAFHTGVKNLKLKSRIKNTERLFRDATIAAAKSELLLPAEPGALEAEGIERTFNFKQTQIYKAVDVQTSQKIFDLKLDTFGPYTIDYTRNGRFLALAGRKGHIAMMDWTEKKLLAEVNVNELTRDVKFLQNETMFAVAQRKYVYVYDKKGVEIHCLKKHIDVNKLEYLPYHFLLASVGNAGYLKYQDVSTGQLVCELRSRLGPCNTLAQNPRNAVLGLGHASGVVTMWSPALSTPLVRMLCHQGLVTAAAYDHTGNHLVTAGMDGYVKVWDMRTYKELHSYHSIPPATSIDISQRGIIALAARGRVQLWKDAMHTKQYAPYMNHSVPGSQIADVRFCPFEDVLGLGHTKGFSSIVVPGAGEPNIDTFEANPYETTKQRQETEVRQLLEKLQPDMITLDSELIGTVDRAPKEVIAEERRLAYEANNPGKVYKSKGRKGQSGARRFRKRQENVWDEKKARILSEREKKRKVQETPDRPLEPPSVLDRFKKRKRD